MNLNREEEKKMIETVMGAWATFAKDPKEGLKKYGWPIYDPESKLRVSVQSREWLLMSNFPSSQSQP